MRESNNCNYLKIIRDNSYVVFRCDCDILVVYLRLLFKFNMIYYICFKVEEMFS